MRRIVYWMLSLTLALAACGDDGDGYVLQRSDIVVTAPGGGYVAEIGKPFHLQVKSVSDEGVTYQWMLGETILARTKHLTHVFEHSGQYRLTLRVSQGTIAYDYNVVVEVKGGSAPSGKGSPYIAKVFDYRPAVGQFTNLYPSYSRGDTQADMNRKVLNAIGGNNLGLISLGGYGGYVVLGFDHTIENVPGKRDFRILGNTFSGSAEPGIVVVAQDTNGNGLPDDEWYEIAGSAHRTPSAEPWLEKAREAGNDVTLYRDYRITYHRPTAEPTDKMDFGKYIRWEDNQGNEGYRSKNVYHAQSYYPLWIEEDELTFSGTCLPQNFIDENGDGSLFVGYKFGFGYADNEENTAAGATIDIDWAVTASGEKARLKGVDFIKIYTGVNQENGWLGECSTELSGVEDLHVLKEDIDSPEF